MKHTLIIIAVALLSVILLGHKIDQLQRIVADQRVYMDAGCGGRYQGAE